MPIKAIKNNELKIMPLRKPENVERNIYNETQDTLLNAFNMVGSILNRHRDSCLATIKPENIGDILKLANAMSAIQRVAIESEKWEYQKTQQIEEAANKIIDDVRRLMKDEYPDLYAKFLQIVHESVDQQTITLRAHIDPRAMLSAPIIDVNEGNNASS